MVGKWNRSVILTYFGILLALTAMFFFVSGQAKYAMLCFMTSGICDLFDGAVARKCKRTEEEKSFGIQLDSLADVFNFVALPIVLIISVCGLRWYSIVPCAMYAVLGIARLAYFNVVAEEKADKDKPVKYYTGLPVTYAALIFPVAYLLTVILDMTVAMYILCAVMAVTALLFGLRIKFIKPGKKGYIFFSLLLIAMLVLYIVLVR